ncbi:MAG: ABC transporter permease [Terriglobia bacterium]
MTRAQLVAKNLFRNCRRTFLTAASVGVSICLLSVFVATYRYITSPPAPGGFHLLLIVTPRTSWLIPLPLHYRERIVELPGVAGVSPVNMVDAPLGSNDKPEWILACDPAILPKIYTGWKISPERFQAFASEKRGLLVGQKVAEKHRWQEGDLVHVRSANYHVEMDLVLRAIYRSDDEHETMMFSHWDYLNDAQGRPNKPGGFWVLARASDDVAPLTRQIDELFRNADVETRTQPMKQLVLDMLAMVGNVKLILISVSAAAVFAVLLIVVNTMGMSIRERTTELAILRALGFRFVDLLGLLTSESLVVCVAGALAGCGAAALLLALIAGYRMGGAMPIYIRLDLVTMGLALAVAAVIGLFSTLLPACRAGRANIAQALRYIG